MKILSSLFIFLLFALSPFYLIQAEECYEWWPLRHQLFLGPEIYHVARTREGGTKQRGFLYGARLGYDYIRRYAFYWGIDGLYARGTLSGETGEKKRLKSELTDINLETRFGYTFQSKACHHFSFTPFIGVGYFWEMNNYQHPSPIEAHFRNEFFYVPVGFLSQLFIYPKVSLGLNFKTRYLLKGTTKVTHDHNQDNHTLHYEHKLQYRVDLPLTYYFCWRNYDVILGLIPFYEYRHYGHQANFPFDFLETKFRIYGVNLRLFYPF